MRAEQGKVPPGAIEGVGSCLWLFMIKSISDFGPLDLKGGQVMPFSHSVCSNVVAGV